MALIRLASKRHTPENSEFFSLKVQNPLDMHLMKLLMSSIRLALLLAFGSNIHNCLLMNLFPPLVSPSLVISFEKHSSTLFSMFPSSSTIKRDAASMCACYYVQEGDVLCFCSILLSVMLTCVLNHSTLHFDLSSFQLISQII